ncbi:hypothetical protein FLK61_39325 [Paenalkalicoccus suaedae]|uniref:Uncharacterized protein n=1 Tax=Paenalkalicoccus suaedae TaxID=2592382 RepID=A0A859FHR7_9BACI|nr:hypothetical protein [Paenalkalicoccus suaedae]QKS72667.1 hypothetical protein FLK61_39325 [Paenalkalicoccus suaedae]
MQLKSYILRTSRLLRQPRVTYTDDEITAYKRLLSQTAEGTVEPIAYDALYPKHRFLQYVAERTDTVLHGSNNQDIRQFEPRDSTLFTGQPIKAVFAANDGTWPLFFATQNRRDYHGSIRNICIKTDQARYYYFSVENRTTDEWTDGTVYLLPKTTFKQGGIKSEWVSEQPVKPYAKLAVTPEDFPFLEKVSYHEKKDPIWRTLLRAFFVKK